MTLTDFAKGTVICEKDGALRCLWLIVKGSVGFRVGAGSFLYEQGDLVGLCDFHTGVHSHTCTALSDVSAIVYDYEGVHMLDGLLCTNADAAMHAVHSLCRQMQAVLQYRDALRQEADVSHRLLGELYAAYEALCGSCALIPKRLPGLMEAPPFAGHDPLEDWARDFYMEISQLDPAVRRTFFYSKPGIVSGFLRRSVGDIPVAAEACRLYEDYVKEISLFYLNDDAHDLLSLATDLHINSVHIEAAHTAAEALVARVAELCSHMTGIASDDVESRLCAYREALALRRADQSKADTSNSPAVKRSVSDSLEFILQYAECDEELYHSFTKNVQSYRAIPDRGGSDSDVIRLRKELSAAFYTLYGLILRKSLSDPALPTVIKMFLHFGYVDAELAGHENTDYLYAIADSVKGDPDAGIYTLPEWLAAIYKGQREPSRNENDLDFTEYVRELKTKGDIDAGEEVRLLGNCEEKLRFEMENVFPVTNKLTSGRVLASCPLFSDHAVQGRLENTRLTPALLREYLDEIRSIDHSAFYREVAYANQKCGIRNEYIHAEILPCFILMPNVGTRGILWQEIEGKNRATPGRIFLPHFLEVDAKALCVHLTGELRWEICKRVQGIRWNDVATPSLTSLFSDYMQFYKANRELNAEARALVKTEYDRAKKNNRTLFATYYAKWLLNESKGSPQLNKVVFRIFAEFCPFSAAVREKLASYPRYAEMLRRNEISRKKNAHRMANVIGLATRTGGAAPQELLDELAYLER